MAIPNTKLLFCALLCGLSLAQNQRLLFTTLDFSFGRQPTIYDWLFFDDDFNSTLPANCTPADFISKYKILKGKCRVLVNTVVGYSSVPNATELYQLRKLNRSLSHWHRCYKEIKHQRKQQNFSFFDRIGLNFKQSTTWGQLTNADYQMGYILKGYLNVKQPNETLGDVEDRFFKLRTDVEDAIQRIVMMGGNASTTKDEWNNQTAVLKNISKNLNDSVTDLNQSKTFTQNQKEGFFNLSTELGDRIQRALTYIEEHISTDTTLNADSSLSANSKMANTKSRTSGNNSATANNTTQAPVVNKIETPGTNSTQTPTVNATTTTKDQTQAAKA